MYHEYMININRYYSLCISTLNNFFNSLICLQFLYLYIPFLNSYNIFYHLYYYLIYLQFLEYDLYHIFPFHLRVIKGI